MKICACQDQRQGQLDKELNQGHKHGAKTGLQSSVFSPKPAKLEGATE